PTVVFEQVITNGVDRAEVQEQRREHDQAGAAQKGNCQVQVFVGSNRRVEVKDIRRETERRKVQHERRAATLLEDYEQANAEIDQPDQIGDRFRAGQFGIDPKLTRMALEVRVSGGKKGRSIKE